MERKKEIKEKKKVTMKASKIFMLDKVFYELEEQKTKFPLNVGYAVYKMGKQVSEAAEYISDRLFSLIDSERMRMGTMTDEEQIIYNAVMESEIDLKPFGIRKDEFFENKEAVLSLQEIPYIEELFPEN
jgi:hypothetical protein